MNTGWGEIPWGCGVGGSGRCGGGGNGGKNRHTGTPQHYTCWREEERLHVYICCIRVPHCKPWHLLQCTYSVCVDVQHLKHHGTHFCPHTLTGYRGGPWTVRLCRVKFVRYRARRGMFPRIADWVGGASWLITCGRESKQVR